jgi:ABC-type lipoprotein release transport system permease subunit
MVSIVGVLLGVAFLVLTLGVYDSYVDKLETIAFALYPHVLLVDGQNMGTTSEATEPEPMADADPPSSSMAAEVDGDALCDRICGGELLFGAERWVAGPAEFGVTSARFAELEQALKLAGAVDAKATVVAPVILEEGDLALSPSPEPATAETSRRGLGLERMAPRAIRVLGIDPGAPRLVPRVDLVLTPEQIERLRREPGTVFLASALWQDILGADATSNHLRVTRPGASPVDLPLGGQFELGFHAVAHNLLITSLDTARELLALGDGSSYVGIALENPYRSRKYLEATEEIFDQVDFRATDWTGVAGGDFESIRLFRWILFLVLGLSFLITALGIRNALAILTLERRRQIGILRALGSRDRSLRLIFLTIACGIGLAGTLPGAVLGSWFGIGFGRWLDQELAGILPLRGVEVVWQPVALGQVLALVLLVCALTSMVAVGRALELDTVTCLREE